MKLCKNKKMYCENEVYIQKMQFVSERMVKPILNYHQQSFNRTSMSGTDTFKTKPHL